MFAVADQRRFTPWLAASALAHVLGAVCLIALRPLPSPLPEPLRVVRVDLLGPSAAPGPPAAPLAAEAASAPPAPTRSAPVPPPAPAAKPALGTPPAPTVARAPAAPPAEPTEAAAPAVPGGGGTGAAEGAALAAVATGPPGGGGGGGADALAAYIARLQQAIDAHKSYPPMARRRGIEGVVTVRLAIDAAGGLERTSLVGRAPEMLARSTREAVDRASPFPPPPGGPLQIEFPVRYEIVE